MRLKLPKNLPLQIRELITMDFSRANPSRLMSLDERPAAGVPEAPLAPPASAPSTNRTNGEPCPPTTSKAPSTNRAADVCEAGKPSQSPSTNRPNGEPTAGASKTRPSTNRPNRAREPSPVCGGLPGGKAADVDEKRT